MLFDNQNTPVKNYYQDWGSIIYYNGDKKMSNID